MKRFVVCAGGSTRKGDPRLGAVWAHLEDVGAEYLVLRPTWFIGKYSFIRLKRNIPRFSTVGARRLTPSRQLFGVVPPDPQEREQDLHVLRGCDYGLRQRRGYRGAGYQRPHLWEAIQLRFRCTRPRIGDSRSGTPKHVCLNCFPSVLTVHSSLRRSSAGFWGERSSM